MAEEAYPKDHPAHPDNAGKQFKEPPTDRVADFKPDAAQRGGQGQGIPTEAGSNIPRDGFKHLHGLDGATLAEREKSFSALPEDEQAARLLWNKTGIPAAPEEE